MKGQKRNQFSVTFLKNKYKLLETFKIIIMKKAAIIATSIATLLFVYSSYTLTFDPLARSTKDGMLFFNFMLWYTIPGILWGIYFFMNKK
jgi:hypothetical protein